MRRQGWLGAQCGWEGRVSIALEPKRHCHLAGRRKGLDNVSSENIGKMDFEQQSPEFAEIW